MKFRIINQCFQNAANSPGSWDVDFLLEEDKWDDFQYHTLYHLHASSKLTGSAPEYLGPINIMRLGQKEDQIYLIRKTVGTEFESLPDDFCSITMSVEFYRGIDRYLKKAAEKKALLEALKMILSEDDPIYRKFKDEACFMISLMRNASMNAYGLKLGQEIMTDDASLYDLAEIPLKYTLPDGQTEVSFDFSSARLPKAEDIEIPSRLLVCIGNNGAGKSTLMYRLARILFARPSARQIYADSLGGIEPIDAGFRRLFILSYSAFDNFIMPGVGTDDYQLILQGLRNHEGRLVYCGIRDLEKEYEMLLDKKNEDLDDEALDTDHATYHELKSIDSLAGEFAVSHSHIVADKEKCDEWNNLMRECAAANQCLENMYFEWDPLCLDNEDEVKAHFKSLSTGIKYIIHSLACIIDRIEPNSIIIFDEPENHIQPPLLSKFIYCLRRLSQRHTSLVMVATHSPVIVQETLSKNVIIVNRFDDKWEFRHPSIETYGENIANITDEVFNLNTSVTNYQKTARRLCQLFPPGESGATDALEYLEKVRSATGIDFGNEIKAYMMSHFLKNRE